MDKKNTIKVYTASNGAELTISAPSTKQIISATNNKAQYYAEQAKIYRDEAKLHRDNAKFYSEQNSDVTFEYIDLVKSGLEDKIAEKQEAGDYALKEEIPVNVSELTNDAGYINRTEFDDSIQEVTLPSQDNCAGMFLTTDGQNKYWTGLNTFQLFDTKLSDFILTGEQEKGWALQGTYVYKEAVAGSRYGYPDFYNKCLEEKESAIATEVTLGDSTITMYVNANGHQFYDIADKEAVDFWFETYGFAWFYGVDQENERIFLPRNKYVAIKGSADSVDVDVYGTGKSLGLTNGSANGALLGNSNGTWVWSNQYGSSVGTAISGSGNMNTAGKTFGVVKDPAKSGITGKADTSNIVQFDDTKYLYICVGNTESQSTITDVIDVTTTENDTIPLLHHISADEILDHPSWLRSNGQWNDGNAYTTVYQYLVNEYTNGTEHTDTITTPDGEEYTVTYKTVKGKKVVDVANVAQVDVIYSAMGSAWYYVINQDDMTFRLPMSHNSECYTSDPTRVGLDVSAGLPNITGWFTQGTWYDTTSGAFYNLGTTTQGAAGTDGRVNVGFDASRSNPIYGNSDTVTPPHTEFYLYFKVANAVQNLELLNAGEVLEAVNNLVPNNSSLIASYAMPSSRYIDLTLGASGTEYTAPATGWVTLVKNTGSSQTTGNILVVVGACEWRTFCDQPSTSVCISVPVTKGQSFKITYNLLGTTSRFRFIYAEGDQ